MIRLQYTEFLDKPQQFLSLTGLSVEEFDSLLTAFSTTWDDHTRHFTIMGEARKRKVRKERKNSQLPTTGDKLFFVLYQFKNNCLQESLAAQFGMAQPHACFWLQLLSKLLKKTLNRVGVLPERRADRINRALAGYDEVIIDGTERPIGRSTDNETQKEDYSGKKKRHCKKNMVLTNKNVKILLLILT